MFIILFLLTVNFLAMEYQQFKDVHNRLFASYEGLSFLEACPAFSDLSRLLGDEVDFVSQMTIEELRREIVSKCAVLDAFLSTIKHHKSNAL